MDVVTTTPGLYPLPDPVKEELADLKGHQKDDLISGDEPPAVTTVYDQARETVIDDQREAGLDRIVEGQLRWDDMLAHPLALQANVEMGGIVRYYDNNNFYREPVVTGALSPTEDMAADMRRTAVDADRRQAVVPGPYTLADLATDERFGDEAEFVAAMADLLAGEVAALPEHATLWVMEPSLATAPPEGDHAARASEAIDAVIGATDAETVVHTYFDGLDETAYAHLLDAGLDAVGFDLVAAHDQSLYLVNEYGTTDDVALGVLDGQNTAIEAAATIRERLAWADERAIGADFDRVYATPNTELFYLPVNKYRAKLAALAAAGDADADAEVAA